VLNVLVTGGSRGLGLAITEHLSGAGYRVIAVARKDSEALQSARAKAATAGAGSIEFRAMDLAQIAELGMFVKSLRAEFGGFYGLVNNAGIGTGGILANMRDAEIQRLITLNTLSPIVLTKYVAKSMMIERRGRIVNVASIVALTGYHGLSVYSATKASLIGFTQSLARELGALDITVNAIAPGFIDTEMTQELDAAQRERIARRSALKRMAEPIDVASSVEFLIGAAARNITGTVLTVDAGNTT
jgi:3-oxoacyl-[acyl-carrier protein] reductase